MATDELSIGTASARPGELARGHLVGTDLPTGSPERLPVVLANGPEDGPEVWITAAIHGDEATGLAAAQDVLAAIDPGALAGRIVCLPLLNPAGLRRNARTSYYHDEDPNRGFPDPDRERHRPPNVQELIDERVYDLFADSADALLDLHTASVGSMPFVIRDRVLYGEHREEAAAEELAERLASLAESTGLPVITEFTPEEYTGRNLQRSTAGAALNAASVPAVTLELGSPNVVEEPGREAGVAAVVRALVELGVLDDPPIPLAAPIDAPVEYPVRREIGPRVETAGIVRHDVDAGDVVEAGDPIARVVTPAGESVETVGADHDGYVLGRRSGIAVYENDPVTSLAVRDEDDLVSHRIPAASTGGRR